MAIPILTTKWVPESTKGDPESTLLVLGGTKGLPTKEWIMATYHIAQYIITVAANVAKDVVSDKIEWHSIVFLLFNKLKPQLKLTLGKGGATKSDEFLE